MTRRIGLMTSGGDAPGMNAAVRAVIRTALRGGAEVYGIMDGYMGLQHPEKGVRKLDSSSASGILSLGGTVLGTARCMEMRDSSGRRKAIQSLLSFGIDRLVCIGGDGSLTGAEMLRTEWADCVAALMAEGLAPNDSLVKHPCLSVVGLPGTIDNDLYGSDITIGADTALHRIVEAIDAIFSTAASHQRTFVVEVMGRHCGYLAVMAGLATGAEWIAIPEDPCPEGWEEMMGEALTKGRAVGKRAGIVIVAEGARDWTGRIISSQEIQKVLSERMGEDARVTILGHVQRGGSPSAYDRNLSTLLGQHAARVALQDEVDPSVIVGMIGNRPACTPLVEAVEKTREIQKACTGTAGKEGLTLRGASLVRSYELFKVVNGTDPEVKIKHPLRIAIVHSGAPAPGMNMAVRTAARWAMSKGHVVIGIKGGFTGLVKGDLQELDWRGLSGWGGLGGAELGTDRILPEGAELYNAARVLEDNKINALLMIGGWSGYEAVFRLYNERNSYPAFDIPMLCLPASIDNNLPGSEFSIGADTALNSIIEAVDRVKRSAVANKRCFLVEVMGYECGYLAHMSGLASGAEAVYLHEKPIDANKLLHDINELKESFQHGRTVALIIINERAHALYRSGVLTAMFEAEGQGYFDVRQSILGHLQQGGDPTPYDRTLAARFGQAAIDQLLELCDDEADTCGFIGQTNKGMKLFDFHDFQRMIDPHARRPRKQWWLNLEEVADDVNNIGGKETAEEAE